MLVKGLVTSCPTDLTTVKTVGAMGKATLAAAAPLMGNGNCSQASCGDSALDTIFSRVVEVSWTRGRTSSGDKNLLVVVVEATTARVEYDGVVNAWAVFELTDNAAATRAIRKVFVRHIVVVLCGCRRFFFLMHDVLVTIE